MSTIRDIPASELRTHLGAILEAVRAGDTIGITHRGERIARLVPEAAAAERRRRAVDSIHAFRAAHKAALPRLSAEEIKALIDEGRHG